MTRFEYFENGYARVGMQLGVVSMDDLMKFVRYKVYSEYINQGKLKMDAIQLTCERMKCEKDTVYRAINYFKNSPDVI